MIITGGEPELLWQGTVWHPKREGGVTSMHARMHYVFTSLVQNAVCACCGYVEKCEKGFVWSDQQGKLKYVKAKMVTLARKCKYEEVHWSLSHSSFAVRSLVCGCLCFSLSHRQHSRSCSYHHYALHCSHERGIVSSTLSWGSVGGLAWQLRHMRVQCICITWMGWTRSVVPVDHTSVWLTRAHPKKITHPWDKISIFPSHHWILFTKSFKFMQVFCYCSALSLGH